MGKAQAMLGDIISDLRRGLPNVDGQNDQALVLILGIEGFESGPLSLAMWSPGGPEVDEDHFLLKRA